MDVKLKLSNTEHKDLVDYCNLNDLLISSVVKDSFTVGFNIEKYGLLNTDQEVKEVEVIKEVIKYVEVEKPVEVIKEVIVEKTVEVIKEVPVERIVEKIFFRELLHTIVGLGHFELDEIPALVSAQRCLGNGQWRHQIFGGSCFGHFVALRGRNGETERCHLAGAS